MKIFLNLIIWVSFCAIGFAQDLTVSGIVFDFENKQPLPGASVFIDGTTKGTTTDFDGNYTLDVKQGDRITFDYVGYQSKTITFEGNGILNVELTSDNDLEEVVVVGYGTQKRSNLVGSVATVDVKKATQIPTTNVSELLRGRAAGVQVTLGDARPGGFSNIVIRGNVSVAGGNNPLIIVDGLPYDNLNDISPDDIQSVEILKDAASTSIYGARASNGVVLVTTKKSEKWLYHF